MGVHGEFAIYAVIGSWNSPRQWGCHITSLLEAGASDARQGVERIGGRENMKLIEIPENQWPEFCKGFSREHRGWLVNLRCVNTDQLGRDRSTAFENGNVLAEGQPLQGVRSRRAKWLRMGSSYSEISNVRGDECR